MFFKVAGDLCIYVGWFTYLYVLPDMRLTGSCIEDALLAKYKHGRESGSFGNIQGSLNCVLWKLKTYNISI